MPLHTYHCPACESDYPVLFFQSELAGKMPSGEHPECPVCSAAMDWVPSVPGRPVIKGNEAEMP